MWHVSSPCKLLQPGGRRDHISNFLICKRGRVRNGQMLISLHNSKLRLRKGCNIKCTWFHWVGIHTNLCVIYSQCARKAFDGSLLEPITEIRASLYLWLTICVCVIYCCPCLINDHQDKSHTSLRSPLHHCSILASSPYFTNDLYLAPCDGFSSRRK